MAVVHGSQASDTVRGLPQQHSVASMDHLYNNPNKVVHMNTVAIV